ncbi:uncharacterized protein LOC115631600 [Scaptodrosophila lebanonensis]|uniref:Uncharacterized protein LOC115631600 n=1 Tax=Drosophila lebanonensis TaxID=7225 RepID=A0A6J2UAR9_DROLE|nr:uncharacterized protein LOC115631600 [Scaptodrosophila lebanonensis]
MKLLANLMLIALVASGALALPARNPQDDAEVISVPRRSESADPVFRDFQGVIDTGVGYPFLQPNPPPFAHNLGFFDSFEDILRRFRARLWPVVPSEGGSDDSNDSSESGLGSAFGFGLRPLIPLKPLDPKNANTTSTVKVVDGHKVEVNETVYGDENNVFKVRVVNVRPLASGEEVAEGVSSSQGGVGGQQAPQLPNYGPSTSAPRKRGEFDESEEDDRREPLEKQPADNEVRDIDSAQV